MMFLSFKLKTAVLPSLNPVSIFAKEGAGSSTDYTGLIVAFQYHRITFHNVASFSTPFYPSQNDDSFTMFLLR